MDYIKLGEFDKKLRSISKNYLSMIAVGSTVTGDPYILGRSDKDIVLIYNINPLYDMGNLEKLIGNSGFDESYLFAPVPKNEFGHPSSKYAFSNKFRSKTLHGEDFVSTAKLPEKKKINEIYLEGLQNTSNQIYNGIINSGLWSISKVRDTFWKEFKHVFMYLAIREYFISEDYPKTRAETAKRIASREVNATLGVLHSIDSKSKEEIVGCAKNLMGWMNSVS
jgi:hypothetical protein